MNELQLPEPWLSFLREIDDRLTQETQIHCLGGFVVTVIYGADRTTLDLDALSLVRGDPALWEIAGRGSDLHRRHHLYLDRVGIVTLPEDYEDRLAEVFIGPFTHLRIFALDLTMWPSQRSNETRPVTAKMSVTSPESFLSISKVSRNATTTSYAST